VDWRDHTRRTWRTPALSFTPIFGRLEEPETRKSSTPAKKKPLHVTTTKLYKIAKYRVVLRRQNTNSRPFLEKRSERSVEIICSRDKNVIQKHQNSPLSLLNTEINRRSKKSSENGEGFTPSLKICDQKRQIWRCSWRQLLKKRADGRLENTPAKILSWTMDIQY